MKLCTYEHEGRASWGVVNARGAIVDVPAAIDGAPRSLLEHVEAGDASLTRRIAALAGSGDGGIAPDLVAWRPPIPRPGKILGVALNNAIGQALAHRPFANPAFFLKPSSSLVGHGEPVVVKDAYGVTHPEPELALVIGRTGKAISEAGALGHVFGYTIINDVTSPGLKAEDSIEIVAPPGIATPYQELIGWRSNRDDDHARSNYLTYHGRSKGADTFGPIGPWIVTADEIPDPGLLAVHAWSGDEATFDDSVGNLTFSVERIIAHASRYYTLEAGDVIHCGTAMRPAPGGRFTNLAAWDLRTERAPMRIDIDRIGSLVNPIRVEDDDA